MSASLYTQRLPVIAGEQSAPEMVLLHGWGMDSGIWSALLPALNQFAHITLVDLPGFGGSEQFALKGSDAWLDAITQVVPDRAIYLGFSLGGMLAVQLAKRCPERVSALLTIASNARFVADQQWPSAMDQETFQSFYQLSQQRPALAVKRFLALQAKGCSSERELLKALKAVVVNEPSAGALANGLQVLAALDNGSALTALDCPSLHILGAGDQLVPTAAALSLKQLGVDVRVIAGASHVPFISHPAHCLSLIKGLLLSADLLAGESLPRQLDKQQVARSFSRAASSYDSVATLQRQVGEVLFNTLPDQPCSVTVDLGCGTGFYLDDLSSKLGGTVVAFDLAEGMTRYVKQRNNTEVCVCGDAENIPLSDASVDCIFSSLAIQWCEDNPALFAEIYRVLKPGGKMFFSTLGPDTLFELKQAWSAVDDYVHVNRFVGRDQLQQASRQAGFDALQLSEQMISLEYPQLKNLTQELKGIGAHNMNEGRPAGLTGRHRIKQLLAAYESQRNERGMLPATYQVWYGVLEK